MRRLTSRQIHTFGPVGKRQAKDLIRAQFAGLSMNPPEDFWVVSPWVRDFEIVDHPGMPFRDVGWDKPLISFSDVIAAVLNRGGARLYLVVGSDADNAGFLANLRTKIFDHSRVSFAKTDISHLKGLLTPDFYLKGSMNFTHSGTSRLDEGVTFETLPEHISHARQQFRARYESELKTWV